jgi:DNA-binding transcriptional regulator LsrR (DeoR family)
MPRPKKEYKHDDLKQVAQLHHENGKGWTEIAEILRKQDPEKFAKLTDDEVHRMDTRAKDEQVITFHYSESETEFQKLEQAIVKLLPFLKRVVIVEDDPASDYELLLQKFAKRGSDYFDNAWQQTSKKRPLRVGMCGGITLAAFANRVVAKDRPNVEIHALALVGQGCEPRSAEDTRQFAHVNPIVTATTLWMKCGSKLENLKYVTVQPINREKDATFLLNDLKRLKADPGIQHCIRDMEKMDIFFAAIGNVEPQDGEDEFAAQVSSTHLLHPVVQRESLIKAGIVGEMGYNFFDSRGQVPTKGRWDYILTPGSLANPPRGVDFYGDIVDPGLHFRHDFWKSKVVPPAPRIAKRVVVMAGRGKEDALKAALRGALFNVWITDYPTALSIYEDLSKKLGERAQINRTGLRVARNRRD